MDTRKNKPEKALPHVVTALIAKRGELTGKIEHLQADLRQAVVDLDNVEASIRIFAPDTELPNLPPRQVPTLVPMVGGDVTRNLLNTLRAANRPLTTNEMTEAFMKFRNLALDNPALFKVISKRVAAALQALKNRGVLRTMPGPGRQNLWQINPSQIVRNERA